MLSRFIRSPSECGKCGENLTSLKSVQTRLKRQFCELLQRGLLDPFLQKLLSMMGWNERFLR